jgi:hypothetical protein
VAATQTATPSSSTRSARASLLLRRLATNGAVPVTGRADQAAGVALRALVTSIGVTGTSW